MSESVENGLDIGRNKEGLTPFEKKHESYPPKRRKLVEVRPIRGHGKIGYIILIVDGSPPKGYAIVEPRNRWISLYDAHGKRFRIFDGLKLTEEGGME